MFYLFLAILAGTSITVLMRLGEGRIKNQMMMFMVNYLVCIVLAALYSVRSNGSALSLHGPGAGLCIFLGTVTGVFFLLAFVIMKHSIKKNGLVLSATFMKLGVIVPVVMAIAIFGERPGLLRYAGIMLSMVAIVLIQLKKGEAEGNKSSIWLILLLFSAGFADSMTNTYNKLGAAELKDAYLFITFGVALLCSFGFWLAKERKVCRDDFIFGFLIGIPNYYSTRFLLQAVGKLPASIVYPSYSAASIVLVTVIGLLAFHEKLDTRKRIALGLIVAAIVLLNI